MEHLLAPWGHPVLVGNRHSETVNRTERGLSRLVVACVVCIGVGFAFYWACVRDGATHRSDAGWILSTIVAGSIIAAGGDFLWRLLWAALPWIFTEFLDMRALSAAQNVLRNPTSQSIFRFGVTSAEFLVLMFLWIVTYPDADPDVGIPLKIRRTCQAILLLIGCAIGLFEVRRMLGVLHDPALPVVNQFRWLQVWFSRLTLVLYGLLVCRIALPVSIHAVLGRSAKGTSDVGH
jgi:hypothetical protein